MADLQIPQVAGLLATWLGSERCRKAYRHDVRRAIGMAELPALAVYAGDEEFVERRGGGLVHVVTLQLDYYLGPVEQQAMDAAWEKLREAALQVHRGLLDGRHADWPPAPDPNQGKSLLDLGVGIEDIRPTGKARYGYFHPLAPTGGTSYVGFRATGAMQHLDVVEPSDITDLGPLVGHFIVPAEGDLPEATFLDFQPLGAP